MSSKNEQLQTIIDTGVIAIIRADRSAELMDVVQAIRDGGIRAIEVTLTTPGALDVIQACAKQFKGDILIGAGTVLDSETARSAILAGAEYIVTPSLNPSVIKLCRRYSKVVIPGALTPTEIVTAWECGADLVKVFPATAMGPQYFRDIKGPLPQIDLVPTGGVNIENAGTFIQSGASAIAVGSNLVNKQTIAERNFQTITETARQYIEAVHLARQSAS